ncbi:UPF0161 protein At3g09310 [Coffea eugenioides]|uniref:UPF0161 protein At3g09310-like isoform X1 n=1 Tax=Coffea arabica TaxID=13443 RepID=A0A6P6SYR6_COFAR|nr:UPF0161 protein At3g09310-like [Coffea arabica]XP_027175186.1 UPF0161 protein At3g09310 [Coffea eugenioides]
MATILIHNSNFHHHVHKQHLCPSRCGRNPTTVSLNFSSNLIHHSNLRASVPTNKPRQRGARIVNSSEKEKESIQSNSEDEEAYDLGVKAALSVLRFYKREISPLLPKSCRFVPTCSEYSMIAYKKYGFAKGTVLTAWRLCRCNPLGGSGFDPPRWFDETRPTQH